MIQENKLQKHLFARDLIYQIWLGIEWDKVSPSRRMKIYDEFTSKVKSAAMTSNIARFVERLCAKMGVRSIGDNDGIRNLISQNDHEILTLLREETQFIIILMRQIIESKKEMRNEIERELHD